MDQLEVVQRVCKLVAFAGWFVVVVTLTAKLWHDIGIVPLIVGCTFGATGTMCFFIAWSVRHVSTLARSCMDDLKKIFGVLDARAESRLQDARRKASQRRDQHPRM